MPDPYIWGLDEETGKISPLPASPLLLPAIVGASLFEVIKNIIIRILAGNYVYDWNNPPKGVSYAEYMKARTNYLEKKAIYDRNSNYWTHTVLMHASYPKGWPDDWEFETMVKRSEVAGRELTR